MRLKFSKSRVLISAVLILLALVPWVDTILSITGQTIGNEAHSLPYSSINDIDGDVLAWNVIWHGVALIVFWVILYRNTLVNAREKALWAAGFFFLLPIVAVAYVVKHILLVPQQLSEQHIIDG